MIDEATAADSTIRTVRIVTGSATNFGNRALLTKNASCAPALPELINESACIDFGSTIHSDEAMSEVFVQLVRDLGIPCERIAVLSESATQYGNTGVGASAAAAARADHRELARGV
jgi:hypothetical protein